jgi:HK97 family phage portal protein
LEKRSLFSRVFSGKTEPKETQRVEMINSSTTTFYTWDGNIFNSDIVRSAIRPKANAIGKCNVKHIVGTGENIKIDSIAWINRILEQPNPYMSMQDFLMKMVYQREITHNAFAYIKKDMKGYPLEIYPVPYSSVELVEKNDIIFVKFQFMGGKRMTVPYEDLIHLRKDFYSHDFFGDEGIAATSKIMEVINTTDQGVVAAIKNSALIKWIMKFNTVLRPEDQQKQIDDFTNNYLKIEKGSGVVIADAKFDLTQVKNETYVPNASQMDKAVQRLYAYFGVNDDIVQNKWTEDKWNAFYEGELETIIIQLSNGFTRGFFTNRERGFGNKIIVESSNLAYASMSTKLSLQAMVDRGAMTPNEWRQIMNLGPIEGGSKPIRRLDTAQVDEGANKPINVAPIKDTPAIDPNKTTEVQPNA